MSAITVIRLSVAATADPLERLMSTVGRSDLDLAQRLHTASVIRPFSILRRDRETDVVCFDDELAAALLRGDLSARLVTRCAVPEIDANSSAEIVRLAFETPTHFRVAGFEHQLPDAFSVFGALRSRWQALDYPELPDVRLYRVPVWPENLIFRRYPAAKIPQRGFCGVVHFDLRPLDPDERRAIWTLCRFAEYRGVGKHTSYGMGRVRLLNPGEAWRPGALLACWDGHGRSDA